MTLADLVCDHSLSDVKARLLCVRPDVMYEYTAVYQCLTDITPQPVAMDIVLESVVDEDGDVLFIEVCGRQAGQEDLLSLAAAPWSQWLGMSIDAETLDVFDAMEIIICCLEEMTSFGHDQETIQATVMSFETLNRPRNP